MNWFTDIFKEVTMATVSINGKTYEGTNIDISGGNIIIDGIVQQSGLTGIQEIRIIDGSINQLKSTASVTCTTVTGNIDAGGSVTCSGDVGGYIDAGGSINCGNVGRYADAGGSINCGNVTGNVDAGGSVRRN